MELSTKDYELLTWLRDHSVDMQDLYTRLAVRPITLLRDTENLQDAINNAAAGATLHLDPAGMWTGNYILKSNVTLKGGTIVTPNNQPALWVPEGVHQVTFDSMTVTNTIAGATLVAFGDTSTTSLDLVPTQLSMQDCLLAGHASVGAKRGLALNSGTTKVLRTKILDIKGAGYDTQAICGWNGPGDYLIKECYLEAAGENVMFGGSDARIANLIPTNIVLDGCHLYKPLAWRGSQWTVKNLFELKVGKHVVVTDCVLENVWRAAQVGYAVLLKSVNQDGNQPWAEVSDVTIQNSILKNVSAGFNLHYGPQGPNVPMSRVTLRNNFIQTNKAELGGTGYFILVTGVNDLTVDANTAITDGSSSIYFDSKPSERFQLTRNILIDEAYGFKGPGAAEGKGTLAMFAPESVVRDNLMITASPWLYPDGNRYEPTLPADTTGYGAELG